MRRAVVGVLLALLAAGCSGADASDAIERARTSLEEVRSGEVRVSVTTGALEGASGDVGFEVTGPFDVGSDEPRAQLTYRRFVADTEQVTVVTAIGETAFVEVDGTAYELDDPPPALQAGPLDGVDLVRWLVDPQVTDSEDGAQRIQAALDPPVVLRDLVALAAGGEAGAGLEELAEADAQVLRAAARMTTAELETTPEGYLRSLTGRIDFGSDLADAIGGSGARIEFELAISRHEEPVEITAPPSPRPQSELPEPS